MEASRGIDKEDGKHTMDDALKNLNTSMTIVNGMARRYLGTSYPTFQDVQIFSIQSIKYMIILLSIGVDVHTIVNYIHIEHRKNKIPIILEKKVHAISYDGAADDVDGHDE